MTAIRWLFSFPMAGLASFVSWMLLDSVFNHSFYGGGILRTAIGITPVFLRAAIPTTLFVIVAIWIAPRRSRAVPLICFAGALLFSAGGIEILQAYQYDMMPFWIAGATGVLCGALAGLLVGRRMHAHTPNA